MRWLDIFLNIYRCFEADAENKKEEDCYADLCGSLIKLFQF